MLTVDRVALRALALTAFFAREPLAACDFLTTLLLAEAATAKGLAKAADRATKPKIFRARVKIWLAREMCRVSDVLKHVEVYTNRKSLAISNACVTFLNLV